MPGQSQVTAYIAPATTAVSVTAAVSTGATLTLPAAGAGLFIYLTFIEITLVVATTVTGAATPIAVTTTGITGTPSFRLANGTSAVVGALLDRIMAPFAFGLKGSAANTAMVFTAPIVTGAIWSMNATYYADI